MSFGVDYSITRPTAKTLQTFNVDFVVRYVSTPHNPKNISRSEVNFLLENNIEIVIVFETIAQRALDGFEAGANDAREAQLQLKAAGLPKDMVVYYAVDFEPTVDQIPTIKDYFHGCNSVAGVLSTGCYANFDTCRTLHTYGLVAYIYQTYAWSNGKWLDYADIRQYKNSVKWPEGYVDYDSSHTSDFGQYPRPSAHIPPPKLIQEDKVTVLNIHQGGPAVVLGVPSGAKKVILRADPSYNNGTQPHIRVGAAWSTGVVIARPEWQKPTILDCTGKSEITFARLDAGDVPVTVEFGS